MPHGFPALALNEPFTVRVEAEGITAPKELIVRAQWAQQGDTTIQEVRASLTASNPQSDLTLRLPEEAWNALVNSTQYNPDFSYNAGYLQIGVITADDSTLIPFTDAVPDLTAFIPPLVNGDRWTFRIEGYEWGPGAGGPACAVLERELSGISTWEVVGVDLDQGASRRTYHMRETIVAEMVQDSARGVGYGNAGACGSSRIAFSHVDTLTITQEAPSVLEFGVPFGHGATYAPQKALHNQFAGDSLRTTMFITGNGYAFPWLTLVKGQGLVSGRYELQNNNYIRRWTLERLDDGN